MKHWPVATKERPYVYVGQYLSSAYAKGLFFIGDDVVAGSSSLETYSELLDVALREDVAEGAVIIDKRPISDVSTVLGLPYVDLRLGRLTARGCYQTVTFDSMKDVFAADPMSIGASVSLDIYTELCRAHGARVGYRIGDSIEWEKD